MNRRAFSKLTGLGLAAVACGQTRAAAAPAAKRPNVILMLVDDLGYECLGANGSKSFQTPHVDALAAGGMRFEHAFVLPVCTPTRVALMTGKCNARNYVRFGYLESSQTTFGHLFRDAGYATCIAGKWQLGGSVAEETPKHFGFDEHCLYHIRGTPKSRDEGQYASRYINPGLVINGEAKQYDNNAYAPDICNDFVLDYITRQAAAGPAGSAQAKPFFVYYPMMLTHAPFDPTPDSSDFPGKGGPARTPQQHYQDMVAYNDKLIGRLAAKLDALGLRENTLLLFTGDNGTPGKFVAEMADGETIVAGKSSTSRAGMHVPLVANWPGVIAAGKVCADLVDVTDFLPTICDAAGIARPKDFVTDGRSFLPQLRGERGQPREWIYSWFCPLMAERGQTLFEMAFTKRFKLYRTGEFYDWQTDSAEERPLKVADLTGEAAAAARLLQAALERYKDARPASIQAQSDALLQEAKAAKAKAPEGKEKKKRRKTEKESNTAQ